MLITVETPVVRTARVMQMEGIFDVPPSKRTQLEWDVRFMEELQGRDWSIGLVVGPSGSGKTTVAKSLWPEELAHVSSLGWDPAKSVLDSFPAGMPVREVVELLNSVGFSSPPAWVRPFRVLSTGEQFRVTVARLLGEALARSGGEARPLVAMDEFTSVVDRTVARVGSAAIARTIRGLANGPQFVAITCHYDVEEWLQPDWVYTPVTNEFHWRSVQPRPAIELEIQRVHHSAWELFKHHHYLDNDLNHAAICFVAFWDGRPVAFNAWLPQPHGQIHNLRRGHRTVTLPDYQGVGIGNALSAHIASMWKALGFRAMSTTSHPAMVRSRARSTLWRMHRPAGRTAGGGMMARDHKFGATIAIDRLSSGFEYVGPAMDREKAKRLLNG
jgi:GNAT superfamily N-acetyltransferase